MDCVLDKLCRDIYENIQDRTRPRDHRRMIVNENLAIWFFESLNPLVRLVERETLQATRPTDHPKKEQQLSDTR